MYISGRHPIAIYLISAESSRKNPKMSPTSPSARTAISISTTTLQSSSPSPPAPNIPTSPRLPSPPPPVEDLSNPASPSFMPTSSSLPAPQNTTASSYSHGNRRIRKGTKAKDITGPPLVPLSELDSAFQLQEHLAALLSSITNPPDSDHVMPLSRKDCERIASCPEGIDTWMWCYELTRRLTRDLNYLVVGLLGDNCTEETCPEMRASLWQYLCAVHDPPRSCCAMDYSVHTLDHAASTLCSTKHFPSRLNINANGTKQLSSIFRRLYRIFAHAWFLHRSVFWDIENEYGLYVFFRTVSDKYNLIPEDNLTIPTSANGGYDGINTAASSALSGEHSSDAGADGVETKTPGQDSDLEDELDAENNDTDGKFAVVDAQESSTVSAAMSDTPSDSNSAIVTTSSGPVKGDLPLFVFPGEDPNPPVQAEAENGPNLSDSHPSSLAIDGSTQQPQEDEDQSSMEDHQIPVKLDLDGLDKPLPIDASIN
ncbi:hypothetical protein Dda_0414 [Drechslerella dactyloides]|uniref:Mob1/phocein n=1 Tax=Drechslerella dactyloides TaxID=74499 RepID=A0AAD6J6I3_DREDA|nr:hypothetical protein Dda_0414 [Drechslerella dactyloides]